MKREDLLADLKDPKARAAVEAQLGGDWPRGGGVILQPGGAPGVDLARQHGPAPKREDGYRSKAEADYAAWLSEQPGVTWRHETISVGLPGKRTRYRPDFWVRGHGQTIAVEVKGTKRGRPWWREGSRARALHGAAELHVVLGVPLYAVWRVKGEWLRELVEVRS